MEKVRRITAQNIVIIVLSVLLVVSIALGISGAWFQFTAPTVQDEITTGDPIRIFLSGTSGEEGSIETHSLLYSSGDEAVPGDKILGNAYIVADGVMTPCVLKVTIVVTISPINEGNQSQVDIIQAELDAKIFDLYGADHFEQAVTSANTWYYTNIFTNQNAQNPESLLIANEVFLPTTLDNNVSGINITFSISVSAIQAANLNYNSEWWNDMGTGARAAVNEYNESR